MSKAAPLPPRKIPVAAASSIDDVASACAAQIAQLSTAGGFREPLAHVLDRVFVELSRELEARGVPRRVAADMLGMALRTYQSKLQRLTASVAEPERTLWQRVLAFIEQSGGASRKDLLDHFQREDPLSVGAVLADLLSTGLIARTGSAGARLYRAALDAPAAGAR